MRINFYDTRITDNGRTILVKEKGINYETLNMNSPERITTIMQTLLHMDKLAEEHCYMIALNTSCRILGIFFLSKGTVSASLVSPREIFIRALLIGAVKIVLCHNHPSGNVLPSEQDIAITKKVRETGALVNINLADHIIIGRDCYFSFSEAKIL